KLLQACHRNKVSCDVRLPIDKCILEKLIRATTFTINSWYKQLLFRAMFSLAFHAFLRIGEIT
ncbi:hypothetical protein ACJMK2_034804, partial [Sinanodonta woodiana]